jgi:hypothetical protein
MNEARPAGIGFLIEFAVFGILTGSRMNRLRAFGGAESAEMTDHPRQSRRTE